MDEAGTYYANRGWLFHISQFYNRTLEWEDLTGWRSPFLEGLESGTAYAQELEKYYRDTGLDCTVPPIFLPRSEPRAKKQRTKKRE